MVDTKPIDTDCKPHTVKIKIKGKDIGAKHVNEIEDMFIDLMKNLDDILSDKNSDETHEDEDTSDNTHCCALDELGDLHNLHHDKPSIGDFVWRIDTTSKMPYIVDAIHITKDKTTLTISDANLDSTEIDENLVTCEAPSPKQLLDSITDITHSVYRKLETGSTFKTDELVPLFRDIETYATLIKGCL